MLLRSQEKTFKSIVAHDLDTQQPLDSVDVKWVGDSAYISLSRDGKLHSIKVAFSQVGMDFQSLHCGS